MSQVLKRQRYRVDDWADFLLTFRREDNRLISIWCDESPDNPYGGSVSDHHLFSDGHVCIAAGKETTDLNRAIAIAHVFMKAHALWCRTGRRGSTGGRVNV